ncbi:hypothetical protein M6B38_388240 [Iris pallida]|uniref:Uncharacterized protein n=1 Tax=Iris pallida TaxID=29817 RepID=A0AAX6G1F8_IRIPA|nr:hypothetical protein M6B38_388240 [Iris pallida]
MDSAKLLVSPAKDLRQVSCGFT